MSNFMNMRIQEQIYIDTKVYADMKIIERIVFDSGINLGLEILAEILEKNSKEYALHLTKAFNLKYSGKN